MMTIELNVFGYHQTKSLSDKRQSTINEIKLLIDIFVLKHAKSQQEEEIIIPSLKPTSGRQQCAPYVESLDQINNSIHSISQI